MSVWLHVCMILMSFSLGKWPPKIFVICPTFFFFFLRYAQPWCIINLNLSCGIYRLVPFTNAMLDERKLRKGREIMKYLPFDNMRGEEGNERKIFDYLKGRTPPHFVNQILPKILEGQNATPLPLPFPLPSFSFHAYNHPNIF